ncbi:MAG: hypothetical protein H7329_19445 [Opitutaceae bacterium]|nr:hypothetical protein [Cytophagales bacterium]
MQISENAPNLSYLNINSYKAVDNPKGCDDYVEEHLNVLKDFGVKKVTSLNETWKHNPNSYVIVVENPEENKYVAGARVEIQNPDFQLPIEQAIGEIDDSIYDLIKSYSGNRTGEICGLWSSSRVAGNGVAFMLIKSSIVLANLLNMESVFALCSPYTVSMFTKVGFQIETSIGKNGTFYYPKQDLIATAMVIKDLKVLATATKDSNHEIFNLVLNPFQNLIEQGPSRKIEVAYNLDPFNK